MITAWKLHSYLLGLLGGFTVGVISDASRQVWIMAAIAFVVAAMVGALSQIEKDAKNSDDIDKMLCFCGSLFSGLAGFVVYAYSREHIEDPLKILVVVIFAGICGAPLLRGAADQFKKRFLGESEDDRK